MLNYLSRTLLISTLALTSFSLAANEVPPWQPASPQDYNVAEQFFLQHDCRLIFPAVYFYDPQNETWLSSTAATEKFPDAAPLIRENNCQENIPRTTVAETFQITIDDNAEFIVLFVGPLEGMLGVMYPPGSPQRTELDQQLESLDSYAHYPRFWVTPPMTGVRPQ
ncbi:hypothetical protein [Aliidiomarina haloalkalitolerans]|uniref:Uncharacterized protein n=1 Tax=Aliidiomarina haloalkalitolerans TaxID=859059 RepID=A0A432VW12_9GAMM|nr:hypothetical protein [Aliidiomarina haloalkalitolerans]MCL4410889.1 hypothetical protein [Gammaproteobacteria bacterium]RUO20641.1 hypothetical protein CWE06_04845 [Aliidiomarina haloalkalitolerans]